MKRSGCKCKTPISIGTAVRRVEVLVARDGSDCWICGLPVWFGKDWQARYNSALGRHSAYPSVDHVRPASKGGCNHTDNFRLAHRYCNGKRGVGPPKIEMDDKFWGKIVIPLVENRVMSLDDSRIRNSPRFDAFFPAMR